MSSSEQTMKNRLDRLGSFGFKGMTGPALDMQPWGKRSHANVSYGRNKDLRMRSNTHLTFVPLEKGESHGST